MPYKLRRVENEPIFVVDLSGHLDVPALRAMYQEFAALAQTVPGHLYRITNFQDVESNFHDMLEVVSDASTGSPGSTTDPNITVVFVGSDLWVKFASQSLQQSRFGSLKIPIFRSVDDALAAVRLQIAEATRNKQSTIR